MRLSYIVLLAAASLMSTANASPAGKWLLRSQKTTDRGTARDEERGIKDVLDDLFYKLPNRFSRMKKEPSHQYAIFENWRKGLFTEDSAVKYMKDLGMKQDDIDHFITQYSNHVNAKGVFFA
ncbi:unnamed protein product [Phytophthora fragariaefolia]|uniref:Unnamed protein product n=1 Tax=Phytophthora fragariaefolia TaxID=1490495 RepID=A0A9W7CTL0_9STRA|nr:unnamed protein product [Phytophthora fragariaefolia]